MQTAVISLGGSIIIPKEIDTDFLLKFKKTILGYIKSGNRAVIVCGGGSICRTYQNAAEKLTKTINRDKDWIGIMATRLNAELVRVMFKDHAYEKVIYDPHEKISTDKKIIIGAGYEPGCSTDTDMVILAKLFKANLLINTTDTDYVYDKDPRKYKDAKKLEHLSWNEYKEVLGGKWEFSSGMHAPFDPIASKLAQENKLKVAIINGKNLDNLKYLLEGKKFIGTILGL